MRWREKVLCGDPQGNGGFTVQIAFFDLHRDLAKGQDRNMPTACSLLCGAERPLGARQHDIDQDDGIDDEGEADV